MINLTYSTHFVSQGTSTFLWVAAHVIVEKCGYPEMYVHIFGERRFSEQLPIWGSLWLSENCRNAPGMTLLKIDRHKNRHG